MKRWAFRILALAGLFTLMMMLPALAEKSEDVWRIVPLQGYEYRVKLRSKPSKGGEILGQYYAGTEMTLLSVENGWAKVSVGGREGYMQEEFLTPSDGSMSETMLGMVIPSARGGREMWTDSGDKFLLPETYLNVLGTVDEATAHVAVRTDDGVRYGYATSDQIAHVDNFATLTIRGDEADQRINVRESPSKSAHVVARLFPGVRVYRVFDDHTADDGWVRIHLTGMTGYVMDEFLDSSSAGVPPYRPRPVVFRDDSTIVGGSIRGTIRKNEPMWLLGTAGANSGEKLLYYCSVRGWDLQNENRYVEDVCFFQQAYMGTSRPCSVSTEGRLTKAATLYTVDYEGKAIPMTAEVNGKTLTELPVGTKLRVHTGTVKPGDTPSFEGYVTSRDAWLYVEVELSSNEIMDGYVPVDCVTYDHGLDIPDAWNNG